MIARTKEPKFNYAGDLHTHTWASGHASGTVEEIAEAAAKRGLKLIAVTDHGPAMVGTLEPAYIKDISDLPIQIGNVIILRGIEANVTDLSGSLDIPYHTLTRLEWIIASLHEDIISPVSYKIHTELYLRLAENPWVDMIGHPDTPAYDFDYEHVIREFGAKSKIVEINNYHAFYFGPKHMENCEKIAKLCMKYDVCVAVNSDAHSDYNVGKVERSLAMLEKIGFPEELILNTQAERILNHVRKRHPQYAVYN
jgi:putative hydrolase